MKRNKKIQLIDEIHAFPMDLFLFLEIKIQWIVNRKITERPRIVLLFIIATITYFLWYQQSNELHQLKY
jgi:hypothetical protein